MNRWKVYDLLMLLDTVITSRTRPVLMEAFEPNDAGP